MAGKGRPKTGGRQKGTQNKVTVAVKEMVVTALDNSGGVAYLERQAEENPSAFMSLISKCIPAAVEAKIEQSKIIKVVDLSGGSDGSET